MKKSRIVAIAVCLLVSEVVFMSCSSPANQALTEEDKHYFQDVTAKAQDGWNLGDRESYVSRYSDDAIYMPPHAEMILGKDNIRTFANSFPEMQVKFPIAEITGSADYAFVRGTFVLTDSAGARLDKGKYVSIWKKSGDNQWQLTHDIFNSDLPVSAAVEPVPAP